MERTAYSLPLHACQCQAKLLKAISLEALRGGVGLHHLVQLQVPAQHRQNMGAIRGSCMNRELQSSAQGVHRILPEAFGGQVISKIGESQVKTQRWLERRVRCICQITCHGLHTPHNNAPGIQQRLDRSSEVCCDAYPT